MSNNDMKTCFKCSVPKPLTEFYKHPRMADGRVGKCKECNKADNIRNRASRVDYYREYDRDRFQNDPVRRAKTIQTALDLRKKFPQKYSARTAVGTAVRDGRLTKPELCSNCNQPGRIEGHHADYSRPLDVEWLCPVCNSKTHMAEAA